MAHFARIENGVVAQVIVVGDEYEKMYSAWRAEFGEQWVQTSYNGRIRYNFAGIGYTYDEQADTFIAPKPCNHDELTLNDLYRWECENEEHQTLAK